MPKDQQKKCLDSNNMTENILFRGFVQQKELLKQKNMKIFITHCGGNSLMEGFTSGKCMLCIPFYQDQNVNSSIVTGLGVGEIIWQLFLSRYGYNIR